MGFELIEEGPARFYEVAGHLSPESGFAENLPCSFHLHGNEPSVCPLSPPDEGRPSPLGAPQAQSISSWWGTCPASGRLTFAPWAENRSHTGQIPERLLLLLLLQLFSQFPPCISVTGGFNQKQSQGLVSTSTLLHRLYAPHLPRTSVF